MYWAFFFSFLLAALGGALELVTRHPAQPFKPLQSGVGLLYIAINGTAGAIALYLGAIYDIIPDIFDADLNRKGYTTAVLSAGTASLVILRSSILTVRVDGKDVNFGPSFFITTILNILQREIERELAPGYAEVISRAQIYGFEKLIEMVVPVIKNSFREPEDRQLIQETIDRLKGQEGGTDDSKAADLADVLYEIAGSFLLTLFDDVERTFDTIPSDDDQPTDSQVWQSFLGSIPVASEDPPAGN